MNITRMRHIDYFLGGAICLLLDVCERLRRSVLRRDVRRPEPRRVLVTKYLGMGSILLATPSLRALRTACPGCRIVLLTFESNAAFARRIPLIDEVIAIRTTSLLRFGIDTVRILRYIRSQCFDYVLDLEFFARFSTIMSYLSGAGCRVGYYLPQIWRGDLLDVPVHFNPYRHVSEIFAAQMAVMGINVDDFTITPPAVDAAASGRVEEVLALAGVRKEDAIAVVNVNASDLSFERRWPREHFVSLINALACSSGARFVLVGSPDERPYVAEVFAALSPAARARTLNLAGEQTLDEFIALLSMGSVCITNDSGPLHMAAALGTRTFSFFGPESPILYAPSGEGHTTFYAGIYCSPCLSVFNAKRAMCRGNNICMQAISPEVATCVIMGEIGKAPIRKTDEAA